MTESVANYFGVHPGAVAVTIVIVLVVCLWLLFIGALVWAFGE